MIAELLGLAERGEGEKRGTAPAAPSGGCRDLGHGASGGLLPLMGSCRLMLGWENHSLAPKGAWGWLCEPQGWSRGVQRNLLGLCSSRRVLQSPFRGVFSARLCSGLATPGAGLVSGNGPKSRPSCSGSLQIRAPEEQAIK